MLLTNALHPDHNKTHKEQLTYTDNIQRVSTKYLNTKTTLQMVLHVSF